MLEPAFSQVRATYRCSAASARGSGATDKPVNCNALFWTEGRIKKSMSPVKEVTMERDCMSADHEKLSFVRVQ